MVADSIRWTVRDLDAMPNDRGWRRYEIIEGELIVTRAPHFRHQRAGGRIHVELTNWSDRTGLGEAVEAPGVIFTEVDAVIPDVVWASNERIKQGMDEAGHFTIAPELIVEVLSAGDANEQRDQETKLALYSRYGVPEYWIVNWRLKTVEIYRRQLAQLQLVTTLLPEDRLTSPMLPGFGCEVSAIFDK